MKTPHQVERIYQRYWKWIERPRRILSRWFSGVKYASDSLPKQLKTLRGHLALDTFEVVRVLGWTDQFEEDLYWIVMTRRPGQGVVVELMSAVGGYVPLRGKISAFDYWHTLHLWDMNGATVEYGMRLCKEQNITVL